MMTTNPFDLLGEDDTGDFECLLARAAAKQQEVAAALAGKKHEVLQPPQQNEASGRAQPPQQNEGSGRAQERGWGRGRGRGSGGWGRGRGRFYDHRGPQEYDNGACYGQMIGGWSQEGIRRYDNRLPYYREESFVRGGGGLYYDGENRGGYYRDGERRWVERHRTAQVADSTDNDEGTAKVVDPAGNFKEDQSSESSSKLQAEQETCEAVKGRKEKTEENSKEEKADSENKKKSKKKNKSKDFSESTSEKQKPRHEDYANRMTLGEYEKVLQESRKTLETMKPTERRVDPDQYIGLKIVGKSKKQLEEASESVQPKQRYEENKEKAKEEKRISVPKVISINEFLKGYRDSGGRSQAQFGRSGMNGSGYWGQHNRNLASSRHIDSTGHVAPNDARYEGNYSNWHRSDGRYRGHNSGQDAVGHNEDKSNNGGTSYNGKMSSLGGHIPGYNRERQYHGNATYNENRRNTSYNRGMHNNGSRFNGAKPINNGASYNGVGPVNNGTSYNGDRQGRNNAYYSGEKHNGYFVEDEPKVPATPIVQVGPPPSIEDPKEFPTLPGVP